MNLPIYTTIHPKQSQVDFDTTCNDLAQLVQTDKTYNLLESV